MIIPQKYVELLDAPMQGMRDHLPVLGTAWKRLRRQKPKLAKVSRLLVPVKGPMIGVIQTNVAGKGVEATPAQPANVPETAYDMPPDPCEIRCHPQLGLITCQMMKFNYDHQVKAGAQEPYDPESLLIHWNTLTVYGQNPNESPATQAPAVGAVGGAGGGGGNPPHYPVAAGLGYISPVDYVSPNYQNFRHYKPGGPGVRLPAHQAVVVEVVAGAGETQHLQKLL